MKQLIATLISVVLLAGTAAAQIDSTTHGRALSSNFNFGYQPAPAPTNFRDTVPFYVVYVSDSLTGTTESRLVLCERSGTTESYQATTSPAQKPGQIFSTSEGHGVYWKTVKNVEKRKFFYYQAERSFNWTGSQWMLRENLSVPKEAFQVSGVRSQVVEPAHWVEIPACRILLAVRQQQEGIIFDTEH